MVPGLYSCRGDPSWLITVLRVVGRRVDPHDGPCTHAIVLVPDASGDLREVEWSFIDSVWRRVDL